MVMGAAGEAPGCDNNLEPDPTETAADLRRLLLLWPARPGPPIIPIYMDNAVSNNAAMIAARQGGVYHSLIIDGADQRGHNRPTYAAFQQEVVIGHTNEECDQAFFVVQALTSESSKLTYYSG